MLRSFVNNQEKAVNDAVSAERRKLEEQQDRLRQMEEEIQHLRGTQATSQVDGRPPPSAPPSPRDQKDEVKDEGTGGLIRQFRNMLGEELREMKGEIKDLKQQQISKKELGGSTHAEGFDAAAGNLFPGWKPGEDFADPGDRAAEEAERTRMAAEAARSAAGPPPKTQEEERRRQTSNFRNFMERERAEKETLKTEEEESRQQRLREGKIGGVGSFHGHSDSEREEARRRQEIPLTSQNGWEERLGAAIGKSMRKKKKGGGGGGGDGSGSSDSDLLHSSDDESRYKGAKGAAAYEDEKLRAQRHPDRRYADLRRLLRIFLGVREGQAHRAVDAIPRLPCGTFVTLKRALYVFFELLDFMEAEDWAQVKGLTAQAIRWLILQLFVPGRPDLAWRMTFLPDPLMIQCIKTSDSPDLIDGALQDPRQITACLGLAKDLQTILEKTRGGGANRRWYGAGGGGGYQQRAPPGQQQQQPQLQQQGQGQQAGGAGRRRGRGRGGNPNPDTAGGPTEAPGEGG
jgi:uncharacterized coiled-coil protein SlyX